MIRLLPILLFSCSVFQPKVTSKTKFSLIDKVSTLVRTQINKEDMTEFEPNNNYRSVFVVTLLGRYSKNKGVRLVIKLSPVRREDKSIYFICRADITIKERVSSNQSFRETYKIVLTDPNKFIEQVTTILNNSL